MRLSDAIRRGMRVLRQPDEEFSKIPERKFEEDLTDYLWLLIMVGVLAGIAILALWLGRALFYDLIREVNVHYVRALNYALGGMTATTFFYLFAGTFLLFFLSLLLRPFTGSAKYTQELQGLFYALSPILLFGWVLPAIPGLLLWSVVLYAFGLKRLRAMSIEKGSIKERE